MHSPGNVDQKTGYRIIKLPFALNWERGTTLILAMYMTPGLATYCDHVLEHGAEEAQRKGLANRQDSEFSQRDHGRRGDATGQSQGSWFRLSAAWLASSQRATLYAVPHRGH